MLTKGKRAPGERARWSRVEIYPGCCARYARAFSQPCRHSSSRPGGTSNGLIRMHGSMVCLLPDAHRLCGAGGSRLRFQAQAQRLEQLQRVVEHVGGEPLSEVVGPGRLDLIDLRHDAAA